MIVNITRSKYPADASNLSKILNSDISYKKVINQISIIEKDLFSSGCWNENMISQELEAPMRQYYADIDDETHDIRGYAGYWFDGFDAQIMTIGVCRVNQRSGIGSSLLDTMMRSAKNIGAERMLLEVRVDNSPALALYKNYGFEIMGLRKRYYQPENVDAYTMCVSLSSVSASDKTIEENNE